MKVIGQDDKGEPIWELTEEEYQQWKERAKAEAQQGKQRPAIQSAGH